MSLWTWLTGGDKDEPARPSWTSKPGLHLGDKPTTARAEWTGLVDKTRRNTRPGVRR